MQTRIITRLLCPPELRLPVPATPLPDARALVRGNEAGLAYIAALARRGDLLADRLADAAGACSGPQERETVK